MTPELTRNAALRHDLARAMDDRRHDRALRRDREDERALLEWTQMLVAAARSFGDRRRSTGPVSTSFAAQLIRLERRLAVVAVEEDDARGLGAPAEDGNLPQLGFGDEGVARQLRARTKTSNQLTWFEM